MVSTHPEQSDRIGIINETPCMPVLSDCIGWAETTRDKKDNSHLARPRKCSFSITTLALWNSICPEIGIYPSFSVLSG